MVQSVTGPLDPPLISYSWTMRVSQCKARTSNLCFAAASNILSPLQAAIAWSLGQERGALACFRALFGSRTDLCCIKAKISPCSTQNLSLKEACADICRKNIDIAAGGHAATSRVTLMLMTHSMWQDTQHAAQKLLQSLLCCSWAPSLSYMMSHSEFINVVLIMNWLTELIDVNSGLRAEHQQQHTSCDVWEADRQEYVTWRSHSSKCKHGQSTGVWIKENESANAPVFSLGS